MKNCNISKNVVIILLFIFFINPASALNVVVSDNLKYQDPTYVVNPPTLTWTLINTITLTQNISGIIRMRYTIAAPCGTHDISIKQNGNEIYSTTINCVATNETFSADVTINGITNDVITLWVYTNVNPQTTGNFRIYYDLSSISTSDATPNKIFKCGESTISATFNDVSLTSVNAILSSTVSVVPDWSHHSNVPTTESTNISLSWNGTHWVGTFGNDATLLWGNRVITYTTSNGDSFNSGTNIFVYSDVCTGTGVTNYTQIPSGLGRYTKMLYNGQFSFIGTSLETSFIGWALYPWIQVWGMLFYLLVMFLVTSTIYLKTQNITQPLIVGVFLLLIFSSSFVVDQIYRQYVVFILALAITALYYKVFVRD